MADGWTFNSSTDPASAAPAPTPAPGSAPAPALGSVPATAAAPAPAPAPSPAPAPDATVPPIDGKTLGELLSEWQQEMTLQVSAFKAQAEEVAEWDKRVRAHRLDTAVLVQRTEERGAAQKRVDAALESLAGHQQHIDDVLNFVEKYVDDALTSNGLPHPGTAQAALSASASASAAAAATGGYGARPTMQRERMYEMARSIDSMLQDLSKALKGIADRVNAETTQRKDDAVATVNSILYNETRNLQYIEAEAKKLAEAAKRARSEVAAATADAHAALRRSCCGSIC